MVKKYFILAFSLLLSSGLFAQQNLIGEWLTEDKDGIVEIYQKGDKFYGKIVKLTPATAPDGSPLTDQYNPDKSKRNRPVLGVDVITDFIWNGSELEGGKVYDPNNGKFYEGKIWLEDGNVKMRGYIGFLYRTETWTRVK